MKVAFNDIYLNSAGEKRSCNDDTINTFCIGFTNASIATKQLNIILNFMTNPAKLLHGSLALLFQAKLPFIFSIRKSVLLSHVLQDHMQKVSTYL